MGYDFSKIRSSDLAKYVLEGDPALLKRMKRNRPTDSLCDQIAAELPPIDTEFRPESQRSLEVALRFGTSTAILPWLERCLQKTPPPVVWEALWQKVPEELHAELREQMLHPFSLETTDKPANSDYEDFYDEEAGDYDLEAMREFLDEHEGPAYRTASGKLFGLFSDGEIAAAMKRWLPKSPGLVAGIVNFLQKYHQPRLIPVLEMAKLDKGRKLESLGSVVIESLVATGDPKIVDLAERVADRAQSPWDQFLAAKELFVADEERFRGRVLKTVQFCFTEGKCEVLIMEWLHEHGGEAGTKLVLDLLAQPENPAVDRAVSLLEWLEVKDERILAAMKQV